jgi:glycogen(starch) synthase
MLDAAAWVTTLSAVEAERVVARMPELAGRVSYIPSGLRPPEVLPTPLPARPLLLCIGRLIRDKGFDVALRAFKRAAASLPGARLRIAGDGPERGALEQLVVELDLSDRVEFLGWVTPGMIPDLINQASAVLLPSRREGLSMAGIQAAQMARPLIASRVGGLPEVVAEGETGLLVPPDNVEALAAALRVILLEPERAAAMGQAARRRALSQFAFEGMVDAYDALYARWEHKTHESPG